jgi:hypothetical protein
MILNVHAQAEKESLEERLARIQTRAVLPF